MPVVQPEFLYFSASYIPTSSYIAAIPSLFTPGPCNQEKSAFFKPTYAAPSTPKHTPQLPIHVKTILSNLCLLKNVLAGFAYLPSHKATALQELRRGRRVNLELLTKKSFLAIFLLTIFDNMLKYPYVSQQANINRQ
jgi:hypothetical protein